MCMLSCFIHGQLCATPCTVVRQTLSMEFSRQEYIPEWVAIPSSCHTLDPPDPGIQSMSLQEGGFFTTEPPGKPQVTSVDGFKDER